MTAPLPQDATAAALRDVLETMTVSRADKTPVFAVILKHASRLCAAPFCGLSLLNAAGTELVYSASHGAELPHSKVGDMRWAVDGPSTNAQAYRTRKPVAVHDMAASDLYRAGDPMRRAHVDLDGIGSLLLRRGDGGASAGTRGRHAYAAGRD